MEKKKEKIKNAKNENATPASAVYVLRFSLLLSRHLVDGGHRSGGPFGKRTKKTT